MTSRLSSLTAVAATIGLSFSAFGQEASLPDASPSPARGLGAGPLCAFLRVTLPLSAPSLVLAFMLSLIFGLGAFVTPYLMGSPEETTLAVDVQRQTFENLNWPRGAAEAVAMLVALAIVVAVARAATAGRAPS